MGMPKSKSQPLESPKRWTLRSALLVSVLYLVLGLALFSWLARVDNEHYPYGDSCTHNLMILFLSFEMFADDHDGVFPELSPTPGVLAVREAPDYPGIHPEYLTDLSMLSCPVVGSRRPTERWFWKDPPPPPPSFNTASNDESYLYLGYAIPDQATLEQFAVAYRARIAAGKPFDEDLSTMGDGGISLEIPRLRKDIPGITDTNEALSKIPVFIERPLAHIPGGSNVLYADGHVEFIKMNAKWPVTEEAMAVLLKLDALGKP